MFGRRKYPLPKFPPKAISTFRGLCEAVPVERLPEIRQAIDDYLEHGHTLDSDNMHIDMKTAEAIAERGRYLLDHYAEFSDQQKKLVIGAIGYFINHDDALGDMTFGAGFSDDAQVMNHVLEELKIKDMFIAV
jgi:uncharacterized membrane protein YkvA (DUF1232 family)